MISTDTIRGLNNPFLTAWVLSEAPAVSGVSEVSAISGVSVISEVSGAPAISEVSEILAISSTKCLKYPRDPVSEDNRNIRDILISRDARLMKGFLNPERGA